MKFTKRQIAIFHAIGQVAYREGMTELTTKKIANQVGFTEGALYRHFKGKDDLILSALTFLNQELDGVLSGIDPFLEPENAVKAIFEVQFIYFDSFPHFLPIAFSNLIWSNHQLTQQMQAFARKTENSFYGSLELGQKKAIFTSQMSAQSLTEMAIGTYRFLMRKWLLDGGKLRSIEQHMLQVDQLLLLFKTDKYED